MKGPRSGEMMKKIKIISDGYGKGTQILNADGSPIDMVKSVRFAISAQTAAKVEIELTQADIEATGEMFRVKIGSDWYYHEDYTNETLVKKAIKDFEGR